MVSNLYTASPNSIISKLWNLAGDLQVSILNFSHVIIFPTQKLLRDMHWKCFSTKGTSVTHHLLRGVTVPCPCRQETQPANHLASLHDLHPADKAVLVKCPLQNTVLCSEKLKIKILKFHHQKGRIRRLTSWNECVSPLLFTCKTTIQNLVVYRLWPKSLFMFFFSKCHLS